MKYVLNTKLRKDMDFTSYQIIYEETLEITIKKKMTKENNERIKKRQTQRNDKREHLVLKYRKGQP